MHCFIVLGLVRRRVKPLVLWLSSLPVLRSFLANRKLTYVVFLPISYS